MTRNLSSFKIDNEQWSGYLYITSNGTWYLRCKDLITNARYHGNVQIEFKVTPNKLSSEQIDLIIGFRRIDPKLLESVLMSGDSLGSTIGCTLYDDQIASAQVAALGGIPADVARLVGRCLHS